MKPYSTKMGGMKRNTTEAMITEYCSIYLKMRGEKKRRVEAYDSLKRMGYPESLPTLDRQIRKFKADGHALLVEKIVGAKPILNASEQQKVKDFVKAKNLENSPVALRDVQKFIKEIFGKETGLTTCYDLLVKLDMSRKKCRTKTSGFKRSNVELRKMYWDFIIKLKRSKVLVDSPHNLCSIDTTFTSESDPEVFTWSQIGSGPQTSNGARFQVTNAIVTMVFADGINHKPCEVWTSNKRFAPLPDGAPPTPAKGRKYEAFLDKCKQYEISPTRVHFCKDSGLYTSESSSIYMRFLESVDRDVCIFHDGGRAFKKDGVSIFESMGFKNHVQYPSEVHQFLSPNDFHLHGVKETWRREYYKFDDDVSATLRLMQLIDQDTVNNSRAYFENNILRIKKSDLERVIRG
jgi:transposase